MRKLSQFKKSTSYATPTDTAGLYAVITRLDKSAYVFDVTFIHLIRYALATFCTSEMSSDQLELFLAYISAINGVSSFDVVTTALDAELVKLSLCIEDASSVVCGNSASFTYVACGVDINL